VRGAASLTCALRPLQLGEVQADFNITESSVMVLQVCFVVFTCAILLTCCFSR
jgi:hypothetical protein